MNTVFKTIAVVGLIGSVSACSMLPSASTDESEEASTPPPSYSSLRQVNGTPFDKHLYEGYMKLAKKEDFEHDFENLDKFKERAMRAADGRLVSPEPIADRDLPTHTVDELTQARERLESAFYAGASVEYPKAAATAQVKFDCWMEQQEEDIQQHDIDECKRQFWEAMAILEGAGDHDHGPQVTHSHPHDHMHSHPGNGDMCHMHAHEEPMVPQETPQPEYVGPYIVFFDLDQSVITASADATLREVVRDAKLMNPARVVLTGHTDSSGSRAHNEALSSARVDAVARLLNAEGVNTIIRASHFGENRLRIPTADGVRLEGNRRVEIDFEW